MRPLLLVLLCASTANAETVLRMASAAPDGTAWAREIRAFSREVEALSNGALKLKWYLGGIAGDELQTGERMQKDQLDGVASGGMLCRRYAPSIRVLGVPGLFQSRAESSYIAARLKPTLDEEFSKSGFVNLTEVVIGPQVIFSRAPIVSIGDLRKSRLWVWDLDDVMLRYLEALGVSTVPVALEGAARAYDQGKVDGFIAVPTAALAFQWSTQARNLTPLRVSMLMGCIIIANRAYDALPLESQQALHTAAIKAVARIDEVGRQQDDALLEGLLSRHGLKYVKLADRFRAEFLQAAQAAREKLGSALVSDALMLKVTSWLADHRAQYRPEERK